MYMDSLGASEGAVSLPAATPSEVNPKASNKGA